MDDWRDPGHCTSKCQSTFYDQSLFFGVKLIPTPKEDSFAGLDGVDDLQGMLSQILETCSAKVYIVAE